MPVRPRPAKGDWSCARPATGLIEGDGPVELDGHIEHRPTVPGVGLGDRVVEKHPADSTASDRRGHEEACHDYEPLCRPAGGLCGERHDRFGAGRVQGDVPDDGPRIHCNPRCHRFLGGEESGNRGGYRSSLRRRPPRTPAPPRRQPAGAALPSLHRGRPRFVVGRRSTTLLKRSRLEAAHEHLSDVEPLV